MKILIVDDEPDARKLLRKIAERAYHQVIEAENGEEGLRLAASEKPDLIISDALMPVMDGFFLLREIKKDPELKSIPFVFYSATYTEQEDVRLALSMGADDYIVKPQEPEQLWRDISRALERHRTEKTVRAPSATQEEENEHLRRHTQIMALKLEKTVLKLRESLDIQKEVAEALLKKSEELEKFFQVGLDLLCILDDLGCFRMVNPVWQKTLGYIPRELIGHKITEFLHPDHVVPTQEGIHKLGEQKEPIEFINRFLCKDGTSRWLEWRAAAAGRLVYASARDVTQQRLARQEHEIMAIRLCQAQKMEAMGRLASGVAHDFNNLLTAIEGYSDVLLKGLPISDSRRADLEEIKKAAERAAALTRQLLTFSRKQTAAPRSLNINETLHGLEKMLRRLIGENIEISYLLDPDLKPICADPSQIEQVVVNLMLNSRDSMANGGKLAFETHNEFIEAETACATGPMRPGHYVQLVVTDTGVGMDAETQSHLFEPFFTTKEPGKGTGLGLASVFGIVKQSNGHIFVCSEPSIGTTIKIYLPVSPEPLAEKAKAGSDYEALKGNETVLVAEDEGVVRNIICRILRDNGYKTIEARDGEEAMRLLSSSRAPVHAAIIDLVMPKMNGKQLGEALKLSHPETKVIYTSGYTDDFTRERMGINPLLPFLQKPISATELLKKIKRTLNSSVDGMQTEKEDK